MIVSSLGITYGNAEHANAAPRRMPRPGVLEIGRSEQCIIAAGSGILASATVFLSRGSGSVSAAAAPTLLVFR